MSFKQFTEIYSICDRNVNVIINYKFNFLLFSYAYHDMNQCVPEAKKDVFDTVEKCWRHESKFS